MTQSKVGRRNDRTTMMKRGLLGSLAIVGFANEVESSSLLRKRVEKGEGQQGSFEELWDQAAATVQLELDTRDLFEAYQRELQNGMSMSMPQAPTVSPAPTAEPSASPSSSPTITAMPTITAAPSIAPVPPTNAPTNRPTPRPTPRPTLAPVPPTPRPSTGPTDICFDDLEEYLVGLLTPITDEDILRDPSTPQGQAFEYLLNDPYTANPCGKRIEQRYGLATLYFATNGPAWTTSVNWVGPRNECTWAGVTCESDLLVSEVNLGKASQCKCWRFG